MPDREEPNSAITAPAPTRGIDRAERLDVRRTLATEDQRLLHKQPDTGPASPGIRRGLRFQRADPLRFPIRQPRQ
jgi:hypothetical protein